MARRGHAAVASVGCPGLGWFDLRLVGGLTADCFAMVGDDNRGCKRGPLAVHFSGGMQLVGHEKFLGAIGDLAAQWRDVDVVGVPLGGFLAVDLVELVDLGGDHRWVSGGGEGRNAPVRNAEDDDALRIATRFFDGQFQ